MFKPVISLPDLQVYPIPAVAAHREPGRVYKSAVVVSCFDLHQWITVDDCAFDKSRTVVIFVVKRMEEQSV